MAPHLGSTREWTLLAGALVSWACRHDSRRVASAFSLVCHGIIRVREICPPSPSATCDRRESQTQGHENRRAGSATHQVCQSKEQALRLTWARQ